MLTGDRRLFAVNGRVTIRATDSAFLAHALRDGAVVALLADPTVAQRVRAAIRAQKGWPILVSSHTDFVDALDRYFPVLALLDLDQNGDWQTAIVRSKLRPHTRAIPLYSFASQLDPARQSAARQAGADQVWSQARLLAELPALVARQLHPPTEYPAGWDAPLSALARTGLREFNQGEYFEQHEHLEAAWMAETRPIRELYQGILQIGLAFLQIQRNNWPGALKMFRRGLPRLRRLPAVCQGVQVGELRAAAVAIHAEVAALGPDRLAEFDQSKFPKIEFIDQS